MGDAPGQQRGAAGAPGQYQPDGGERVLSGKFLQQILSLGSTGFPMLE